LDRREKLVAAVEYHDRQREIHQTALDELEGALSAIAEHFEEMTGLPLAVAPEPHHPAAPSTSAFPPQPATSPAANTGEPSQRAPRRDIKSLVLAELEKSTTPHTAKEIAKAIEGGAQSTEAALKHWKGQGRAAEVGGKWHLVRTQHAPAPLPQPAAAQAPAAALSPAPAPQEAPTDAAATSTQDKLIEALKQAGAAGMTDDELAAVGVPYIAIMQYHRLGWMTLDNGRYRLNQQAAQ
jgi:hypothetical protein